VFFKLSEVSLSEMIQVRDEPLISPRSVRRSAQIGVPEGSVNLRLIQTSDAKMRRSSDLLKSRSVQTEAL